MIHAGVCFCPQSAVFLREFIGAAHMPSLAPFTPGGTVSRTVTSSSANVALPTTTGDQIMVTSPAGGNIAFIKFGVDSSITAAVTDTPILPGSIIVLTVPPTMLYVAAIGSATTTLYFTRGDGE